MKNLKKEKSYNKYKNEKKIIDGIMFHSGHEAYFYTVISKIVPKEELKLQVKFDLSNAKIGYIADFELPAAKWKIGKDIETVPKFYIDIKGFKTKEFSIKMRLWKAYVNETIVLVNFYDKSLEFINAEPKEQELIKRLLVEILGIPLLNKKEITELKRARTKQIKRMLQ